MTSTELLVAIEKLTPAIPVLTETFSKTEPPPEIKPAIQMTIN